MCIYTVVNKSKPGPKENEDKEGAEPIDRPWSLPCQDILKELQVSPERGLTASQVSDRKSRYGLNELRQAQPKSAWRILGNQFKSLIILLLAVAAALSFAFGEFIEGVAIAVVIFINAVIGFVTEIRAIRSMEALRRLGSVNARVRRDGQLQEIPAQQIVPGDIVVLEGGDIVTADLRLIEASKLQADESALTGESLPVSKQVEPVDKETGIAERTNMLFKGTAVTRGSGEGVVVMTGMNTELGQISSLVEEAREEQTPLEKRLDQLGHRLIWATLAIALTIAITGTIAGKGMFLMIETSIALAVAAIPEGLPIVATMALARGMWRMARRNALINKLSAVETLGATSIICTDKTGTLTENRMTVVRVLLDQEDIKLNRGAKSTYTGDEINDSSRSLLREALRIGVMCNNASLQGQDSTGEEKAVGDPLEVALLVAGKKEGITRDSVIHDYPEVREEAFDSETKMMATFHETDGEFYVAAKGAPEEIIDACSKIVTANGERNLELEERTQWLEKSNEIAKSGLRVLAVARKTAQSMQDDPYLDLSFVGLVGLLDPPRKDVKEAIDICQRAGIRVVMVTGDQPATARNIALATGLANESEVEAVHGDELENLDAISSEERERLLRVPIFARVNPKQKLDLISLYQQSGAIVAMTGDGVNDAPALKKADIGVAMGRRGTQVAREAADMVLKDDAFSSIVEAVSQGRVIFDNIRKFALYLLSCNVSEIMAVAIASLANAPLPILPLQILFLNLVTDVFPALALGVGEGDAAVMERMPRDPSESILNKSHWATIAGYGTIITVAVLGSLSLALNWLQLNQQRAVTVSFLTLAFAQLWHVFNMRDQGSSFLSNDITRNRFVWGSLVLCSGLLLAAVYIPGLASVLKITDPGVKGWLLVIGMSLIPWLVGQTLRQLGF
jgi:Ca2+-transporting ATPase